MTDLTQPGEGDSAMAETVADDDEPVRTNSRSRPDNAILLLAAVLVVVVAQLVMTWLVLGATTQVRDQSTAANALQKCIIHAQLNENSTTDPSGTTYKAAVNACVTK
jgi:hypothetical protein